MKKFLISIFPSIQMIAINIFYVLFTMTNIGGIETSTRRLTKYDVITFSLVTFPLTDMIITINAHIKLSTSPFNLIDFSHPIQWMFFYMALWHYKEEECSDNTSFFDANIIIRENCNHLCEIFQQPVSLMIRSFISWNSKLWK